jgi:hypothetical protein
MDGLGGEKLEAGFGVSCGESLEAIVAEVEFEEAAKLGFVFDDEDGGHGFGRWSLVVSRWSFGIRPSSFANRYSLSRPSSVVLGPSENRYSSFGRSLFASRCSVVGGR